MGAHEAKYNCDSCGLCCEKMIVEVEHIDVVREPKLLPVVTELDASNCRDSEWQRVYSLACAKPCPMLQRFAGMTACEIYPTRPNVCVYFEPGGYQCQALRRDHGLPYLADVDGRRPTHAEVAAMAGECEGGAA
ncbi:YkgJ family cysteine cluster protein [Candidatus Kaiserbacteria bacterium]|nr:YkgJ family cysteine cluster protein [Candidatus Kaiserbacteria bacterium]